MGKEMTGNALETLIEELREVNVLLKSINSRLEMGTDGDPGTHDEDAYLTVETFQKKYGFHPILLSSLFNIGDISNRILNRLQFNEINYLGTLLNTRPGELFKICGFGRKSFNELERILKEKGLSLPVSHWLECKRIDLVMFGAEHFPTNQEEIIRLYSVVPKHLYNWNEYEKL